ncbi:MAG: lysophospholipid acyltransferase family protein [Elusimicrobiaceae bacterium]|nr:lysophospholipid acyltransferase family protein [Elusimicrobiaceae bacterium]
MAKRKSKSTQQPISLSRRMISWLIYGYSVFLGWTTRVYWFKTDEFLALEKQGKNYIYCIWHNQQLFLLYPYRKQKVAALISQSKDGEYIARVLPYFGMKAVRGSSTRGGARALIEMIRAVREGYHPILTPDGPRGPIYQVQHGILYLARKTGLPIIPVGSALNHKFKVGSWDKMRVPLPFGKTAFTYGKAFYITEETNLETAALALKNELDRVTDQSEQFINKKPFDNTKG